MDPFSFDALAGSIDATLGFVNGTAENVNNRSVTYLKEFMSKISDIQNTLTIPTTTIKYQSVVERLVECLNTIKKQFKSIKVGERDLYDIFMDSTISTKDSQLVACYFLGIDWSSFSSVATIQTESEKLVEKLNSNSAILTKLEQYVAQNSVVIQDLSKISNSLRAWFKKVDFDNFGSITRNELSSASQVFELCVGSLRSLLLRYEKFAADFETALNKLQNEAEEEKKSLLSETINLFALRQWDRKMKEKIKFHKIPVDDLDSIYTTFTQSYEQEEKVLANIYKYAMNGSSETVSKKEIETNTGFEKNIKTLQQVMATDVSNMFAKYKGIDTKYFQPRNPNYEGIPSKALVELDIDALKKFNTDLKDIVHSLEQASSQLKSVLPMAEVKQITDKKYFKELREIVNSTYEYRTELKSIQRELINFKEANIYLYFNITISIWLALGLDMATSASTSAFVADPVNVGADKKPTLLATYAFSGVFQSIVFFLLTLASFTVITQLFDTIGGIKKKQFAKQTAELKAMYLKRERILFVLLGFGTVTFIVQCIARSVLYLTLMSTYSYFEFSATCLGFQVAGALLVIFVFSLWIPLRKYFVKPFYN